MTIDLALATELAERAAQPDFPRLQAQLRATGYCAQPIRLQGPRRDLRGRWALAHGVVDADRARRRAAQGLWQPARGDLPGMRRALPRRRVPADRGRDARRQGRSRHGGRAPDDLRDVDGAELRRRPHARTGRDGRLLPCRPRRDAPTCPHGVTLACDKVHDDADALSRQADLPRVLRPRGRAAVEQPARRALAPHDHLPAAQARAPARDHAEAAQEARPRRVRQGAPASGRRRRSAPTGRTSTWRRRVHRAPRVRQGPAEKLREDRALAAARPASGARCSTRSRAARREGLLFPSRRAGRINIDNFRSREWAPALKAAGIEHRRIYDMRHTFATWSLAAGHEHLHPLRGGWARACR